MHLTGTITIDENILNTSNIDVDTATARLEKTLSEEEKENLKLYQDKMKEKLYG